MAASSCGPWSDNAFGPLVKGCRSNFDFTLLFEQCIFTIGPAAVLLVFTPPRLVKLFRARAKTLPTPVRSLKAVATVLLIAVQLALLVLWTSHQVTRATVPSAVLSFLASLAICVLSAVEHSRGLRPSVLLNIYLLVSVVLDAVQVRTLFLRDDSSIVVGLFTTSIAIKAALLVLEAKSKIGFLKPPYDKVSPEATSGIFNQSFFWWLNPIFAKGFRNVLTLEDLFTTDEALLSEPLQQQMQKSWDKYQSSGKYALVYTVFYCFRWDLVGMIFPRLCSIAFNYAQPFIIKSAISYVSKPTRNKNDGYGLIGATALVYLGIAISSTHYQHRLNRMVTAFRGAMVTLLYSRTLKLQAGVYNESAALTLMSTDVDRLTMSLGSLNEIWATLIEVFVGVSLLGLQLGWICIAPIFIVAVCVYASSWVAKLIGPRQKQWTAAIQQRVGMTSSMLDHMKSIKMMGLSAVLFNTLQDQRVQELQLSKRFRVMSMWRMLLSFVPGIVGPMATFCIFAINAAMRHSNRLTIGETFSVLALITLLTSPASAFLETLPLVGISTGCLERIQAFLVSKPHDDQRVLNKETGIDSNSDGGESIIVHKATICPSLETPPALHDISFEVSKGSLNIILGIVGSGKTTLLKAIIGELGIHSGSIKVAYEHAAYCAQTPWLQNATVRQIVCGPVEDLQDEEWYNTVIHACAFDEDIMQLPRRDETLIGSRGVVLSGGQKQRLALARAIYTRHDLVVLDDVFSAIDSRTEEAIVERLLGKNGLFKRLGSTVILATHAIRHLRLADNIIVLGPDGRISEQGSFVALRAQDGFVSKVALQPLLLESSIPKQGAQEMPPPIPKALKGPTANDVADSTRRIGDSSVYKYYMKSIGFKLGALSAITSVGYMFTLRLPPLWLSWYASGNVQSTAVFIIVYASTAVLAIFLAGYNLYLLFMKITPKTGAGLHKILLKSVMRAPQSFFDGTDSGITLNRFSQDMTLIDGSLPGAAVIFFSAILQFVAQLALVAIGSSYMGLVCPPLIVAVYFLQKYYLRTSRQVRFLDLECKSPLYTHFAETLEGLSTIRTIGWQEAFVRINIELLDDSQKPYYLMYCIQRWLALVLRLLVTVMAVIVIALAVNITDSTSDGRLGVSLSTIITFESSLSYLLMFWTMLETSLGSIARLKGFEESTKSEDKPEETFIPGNDWPSSGIIEFQRVTASYSHNAPALRNVSFTIQKGEKIGICGRTGSGKSSLLSVLLRILDIESGTILIDGIDLQSVPRALVRSRIVTIPQEPFILAGSVRFNADPTSTIPEATIVAALTKVKLWSIVQERGGLDAKMTTCPLSHGQQQIFCLARALIGAGSKIIVLDEATSNVDAETDQLMQRLIREEFSDHTIIMVAHRLDTIMDSDKIAVLDKGRLVEFDSPAKLLARPSAFSDLKGSST